MHSSAAGAPDFVDPDGALRLVEYRIGPGRSVCIAKPNLVRRACGLSWRSTITSPVNPNVRSRGEASEMYCAHFLLSHCPPNLLHLANILHRIHLLNCAGLILVRPSASSPSRDSSTL